MPACPLSPLRRRPSLPARRRRPRYCRYVLPGHQRPFVGRAAELAELQRRAGARRSAGALDRVRGRRVRRRQDAAAVRARARRPRRRRPRAQRRLRRAGRGRAALRADRRRAAPARPLRRPRPGRALAQPPARRWRTCCPGWRRGGAPPESARRPRRACSRACSSCSTGSPARTALLLAIEDLHWADRSTRAFLVYLASSLCTERVLVVATYRPDELHRRHPLRPLLAELERDARARRVELNPLTRAELAEQLADILGDAARDELVEPPVLALGGQPAVRRGAAGRRDRRPRRAAADAARRADAADRAAAAGGAGRCCGCSPRGRRLDHAQLAEASAHGRARAARGAARGGGRAADRRRRARAATRSATRCCARWSPTTCCPASAPSCTSRWPARWSARAEGLPDHGGAHLSAGIAHHYFAAGDQPAALAASVRAAEAAENVHAYGEAAALYERALELWDRVRRRRAAGRRATTSSCCAPPPRAHSREHEPTRAETLLRAALSELDETDDPLRVAILLRARRAPAVQPGPLARGDGDRAARARAAADRAEPGPRRVLSDLAKRADARVALPRGDGRVARGAGDRARGGRRALARSASLDGLGRRRCSGSARYEEGEARAARGARPRPRASGLLQTSR